MNMIDPSIVDAIEKIKYFVAETTGKAPTTKELSDSLKRYFVMNEIKDHILMARNESDPQTGSG